MRWLNAGVFGVLSVLLGIGLSWLPGILIGGFMPGYALNDEVMYIIVPGMMAAGSAALMLRQRYGMPTATTLTLCSASVLIAASLSVTRDAGAGNLLVGLFIAAPFVSGALYGYLDTPAGADDVKVEESYSRV